MTQACAASCAQGQNTIRQITECFTGLADLLMDIDIYIDSAIQCSIHEESLKPRACWSTFWDVLFAMAALRIVTFKSCGFCTELTGFLVGLEVLVDGTAIVDIGNIIWLWLQGTFGGNAGQPSAEGRLLPKLTSHSVHVVGPHWPQYIFATRSGFCGLRLVRSCLGQYYVDTVDCTLSCALNDSSYVCWPYRDQHAWQLSTWFDRSCSYPLDSQRTTHHH